jgi:hypothetical protein
MRCLRAGAAQAQHTGAGVRAHQKGRLRRAAGECLGGARLGVAVPCLVFTRRLTKQQLCAGEERSARQRRAARRPRSRAAQARCRAARAQCGGASGPAVRGADARKCTTAENAVQCGLPRRAALRAHASAPPAPLCHDPCRRAERGCAACGCAQRQHRKRKGRHQKHNPPRGYGRHAPSRRVRPRPARQNTLCRCAGAAGARGSATQGACGRASAGCWRCSVAPRAPLCFGGTFSATSRAGARAARTSAPPEGSSIVAMASAPRSNVAAQASVRARRRVKARTRKTRESACAARRCCARPDAPATRAAAGWCCVCVCVYMRVWRRKERGRLAFCSHAPRHILCSLIHN